MAADMAVVVAALGLAFGLRGLMPGHEIALGHSRHLLLAIVSLPVWLGIFVRCQLYRTNKIASRRAELGRLVHAVAAGVAAMAMLAFTAKLYVARGWLVMTFVVTLLLLATERELLRRWFAAQRVRGRLQRPVLVVGGNLDAIELASMLTADPALGYQVLGFIDEAAVGTRLMPDHQVLGSVAKIKETVQMSGAKGVIVVTSAVGVATANRLARDLLEAGIHVEVLSALRDVAVERLSLRGLGRFPMLHVERIHRSGWRAAAKRGFDIVGAATLLAILAPALAITAVMLKWGSPGPVLFKQGRLGRDGKLFDVLKFRTMVVNAEEQLVNLRAYNNAAGPLFKMVDDPRVTQVGRVLRRFSVDELPQLWNVLRGEMSLVGPRPALPIEMLGWAPDLYQRLQVTPGMTGMWQVYGRSLASFDNYARLDLYYVDNWSLLVDLTILLKTLPAVMLGRGAY